MSKVIILNGCSSSGKTTLATTIQQFADEPFQYISLDQFRDGLPMAYRGLNAPSGSRGAQGLNVVPQSTEAGLRTHIVFGEHGDKVLQGMRHCVAQFVALGLNVVVDDLFFKPDYPAQYARLLDTSSTWLVGVHCEPETLDSREQARFGRFPGTALSHIETIHSHVPAYDIEVDTTEVPAHTNATSILKALTIKPTALSYLVTENKTD